MQGRLVAAAVLVGAGVVYLISPFDLIPDVIPFFGWLDDAAVLVGSLVVGLGLAGSALWLEERGASRRRIAYEPVDTELRPL